jgi:hypothetical protein
MVKWLYRAIRMRDFGAVDQFSFARVFFRFQAVDDETVKIFPDVEDSFDIRKTHFRLN